MQVPFVNKFSLLTLGRSIVKMFSWSWNSYCLSPILKCLVSSRSMASILSMFPEPPPPSPPLPNIFYCVISAVLWLKLTWPMWGVLLLTGCYKCWWMSWVLCSKARSNKSPSPSKLAKPFRLLLPTAWVTLIDSIIKKGGSVFIPSNWDMITYLLVSYCVHYSCPSHRAP